MKIAATLALFFSLPGIHFAPSPQRIEQKVKADPQASTHGQWYLAETGHAVYCYGPVLMMADVQQGVHRVATFCRGDRPMVPLKD
jgi:hypothetical protein